MSYQIPKNSEVVRETLTLLPDKTLADFDALPEGTLAQLIDGEIIMSPSPTSYHQQIVVRLLTQMVGFVDEQKSGEVLVAPLDVEFSEENIFQPDILFVSHERSSIITEKRIIGAPDLVIEVLSRSTAYYDLLEKHEVYEEHGVREYWVVDPMKHFIRVFANGNNGFVEIQKVTGEGIVRSSILPDLEIDAAKVFAKP